MKTLVVLLFVGVSFFNCSGGLSLNHKQESENETVVLSPTPETDDCRKENFKHKSEAEIIAMTPAQRIEEMVKDQTYHMPSLDDDYGSLVGGYIRKDGVKILPVLIEYMNNFDPNSSVDCKYRAMRFIVAYLSAGDLDNIVRLKGIKEGQLAIEAFERAIERMKIAGFDKSNHRWKSNYDSSLLLLEELKGSNYRDWIIKDTLRVRHKVHMTEDESIEFSNFLTSLDPNYPRWSDTKDGSNPLIMENSEKYYKAYLNFKTKN